MELKWYSSCVTFRIALLLVFSSTLSPDWDDMIDVVKSTRVAYAHLRARVALSCFNLLMYHYPPTPEFKHVAVSITPPRPHPSSRIGCLLRVAAERTATPAPVARPPARPPWCPVLRLAICDSPAAAALLTLKSKAPPPPRDHGGGRRIVTSRSSNLAITGSFKDPRGCMQTHMYSYFRTYNHIRTSI